MERIRQIIFFFSFALLLLPYNGFAQDRPVVRPGTTTPSQNTQRQNAQQQRQQQQRQAELRRQQQQRQAELQRQREEAERQRQAELQRQREEEQRQAELQRQREEQQRQAELQRQQEEERQREEARIDSIINNLIANMVYIEGGTFKMGHTPEQRIASSSYDRTHKVTLSSFYICKYEVTQEEWEAIMGTNPSKFKGSKKPVECISWQDSQAFITKLNERTNKKFRLPTEAEWEFAARGGNNSRNYMYSGMDYKYVNNVAWYKDNSGEQSHNVGEKLPNELGIFDMSGNIAEWCQDAYGKYPTNAVVDPVYKSGSIIRGGCYLDEESYCRTSMRDNASRRYWKKGCIGFRLALSE